MQQCHNHARGKRSKTAPAPSAPSTARYVGDMVEGAAQDWYQAARLSLSTYQQQDPDKACTIEFRKGRRLVQGSEQPIHEPGERNATCPAPYEGLIQSGHPRLRDEMEPWPFNAITAWTFPKNCDHKLEFPEGGTCSWSTYMSPDLETLVNKIVDSQYNQTIAGSPEGIGTVFGNYNAIDRTMFTCSPSISEGINALLAPILCRAPDDLTCNPRVLNTECVMLQEMDGAGPQDVHRDISKLVYGDAGCLHTVFLLPPDHGCRIVRVADIEGRMIYILLRPCQVVVLHGRWCHSGMPWFQGSENQKQKLLVCHITPDYEAYTAQMEAAGHHSEEQQAELLGSCPEAVPKSQTGMYSRSSIQWPTLPAGTICESCKLKRHCHEFIHQLPVEFKAWEHLYTLPIPVQQLRGEHKHSIILDSLRGRVNSSWFIEETCMRCFFDRQSGKRQPTGSRSIRRRNMTEQRDPMSLIGAAVLMKFQGYPGKWPGKVESWNEEEKTFDVQFCQDACIYMMHRIPGCTLD